VPVLTADNSSLREVAGEGALYADALDSADIALKLGHLWSDEKLRIELRVKANRELKRFSWDKTAHETLEYILNV
jgi:glycosyltransferase involved in cell wall biosynthesis